MMPFAKLFFLDPEGGSQTTLYCALQEGIEPFSGRYFSNCALQEVGAKGRDDALARKLWEVSERLTSFPWETKSQSRSSNLKRPPVLMSYWLSRCMMQWVFWIMTEHKAVQCFTISNLHNLSLAAVHQIAGFQKDILIMIIIISLNHFFFIFFFLLHCICIWTFVSLLTCLNYLISWWSFIVSSQTRWNVTLASIKKKTALGKFSIRPECGTSDFISDEMVLAAWWQWLPALFGLDNTFKGMHYFCAIHLCLKTFCKPVVAEQFTNKWILIRLDATQLIW